MFWSKSKNEHPQETALVIDSLKQDLRVAETLARQAEAARQVAEADLSRYLALGQLPADPTELWPSIKTGASFRVWSTVLLEGVEGPLGNATLRLFVTPQGMTGQGYTRGLSWTETNLKEAGTLPSPMLPARLTSVSVELIGMDDATARAVRDSAGIAFDFIQTHHDIAPLGAMLWDASGRVGWLDLTASHNESIDTPAGVCAIGENGLELSPRVMFGILLRFGPDAPARQGRVRVTFGGQWGKELPASDRSTLSSGYPM